MVRALIVGSGGQDGRILWDQLQEKGYVLLGLSRSETRTHGCEWNNFVDVRNAAQVSDAVARFQPDQIYYLAAHHHSSQDFRSRSDEVWQASWETHVAGFAHFLEAVRITGAPARIFYASSSRVFGVPSISPQNESTPISPSCIYGVTKAIGMTLARYFREKHGVQVSCGILYNHESPLRNHDFLSQKVVRTLLNIKQGKSSHLEVGDLEACVDWGFAPDFTRAMQLILAAPQADDFLIATGQTHSVREMIETAAACLGMEWKSIVRENPSLLQRPTLPLCGHATHLRTVTGWKPEVTFAGMVRILVEATEVDTNLHVAARA